MAVYWLIAILFLLLYQDSMITMRALTAASSLLL